MSKMSEWDRLNAKYNNRNYSGQMSGIEEDGLYVNKREWNVRLDTDGMTNKELAALSGECVTVVEEYTMASNT